MLSQVHINNLVFFLLFLFLPLSPSLLPSLSLSLLFLSCPRPLSCTFAGDWTQGFVFDAIQLFPDLIYLFIILISVTWSWSITCKSPYEFQCPLSTINILLEQFYIKIIGFILIFLIVPWIVILCLIVFLWKNQNVHTDLLWEIEIPPLLHGTLVFF